MPLHDKDGDGHVNYIPALCNGPVVDTCSSMQHGMSGDNDILVSCENDGEYDNVNQDGEHDNANQLLIQQKSSLPQDLVIDQLGTKNKRFAKTRRAYSLEVGSKVVLKTSTYPNKRAVRLLHVLLLGVRILHLRQVVLI